MAEYYYHAVSSAAKFGGKPEDYTEVHKYLDRSKSGMPDFRHRALAHHSEGISDTVAHFGDTITISTGAKIPVKAICERHIIEDLGQIPTLSDWLRQMRPQRWMSPSSKLLMGRNVSHTEGDDSTVRRTSIQEKNQL